jgi:hypothetical protein
MNRADKIKILQGKAAEAAKQKEEKREKPEEQHRKARQYSSFLNSTLTKVLKDQGTPSHSSGMPNISAIHIYYLCSRVHGLLNIVPGPTAIILFFV